MEEIDLGQTIRGFSPGHELFGRYSLVRILGRGGMGVVWLARDRELARDIALKFVPELLIHDRGALESLKKETCRSLELTHPHIVRIYDFLQDEKCACISMEHVDGDTLANLRIDKPSGVFEADELIDYVQQLGDALDYAHNHAKIVHRDLKPANLMVNRKGDLKVADFGIARGITESVTMLTMQHGSSGTLVYMSPQQLDGERVSPLDDIYSLGATLFELLTGKPPFYQGGVERMIREKTPPSISARREEFGLGTGKVVPRQWEETIAACLAKEPSRRPQSVKEVVARLLAPTAAIPPPTPPPPRLDIASPAPPQVRPWNKTALFVGAGAVLFAGLLVLTVGWFFVFRERSSPGPVAVPRPSAAPSIVPTQASRASSETTRSPAYDAVPVVTAAPSTPSATAAPPRDDALLIRQMVAHSIDAGNRGDATALMVLYADRVDFLEEGTKSREAIAQDLPAYFAHWPIRRSTLAGNVGIEWISSNERKVTFPIDFEARNPGTGEHRANRVNVLWTVRRADSASDFKIVSHKQQNLNDSSQAQVEQMVETHIAASSRSDISTLISLYADEVDFLDEGIKSRSTIESEMREYFARWPIQYFSLASPISITSSGVNERKVSFKIHFTARNPATRKSSEGSADVAWVVRRPSEAAQFKIVLQKQRSAKP